MSYQMLTMGEIVEDLIKESGKPLIKHAEEMGMTQSVLSDIVNNKRKNGPSSDIVKRLAQHFHVSADYLLGLSPARTTNMDLKGVCEFLGCDEDIIFYLIMLFKSTNDYWIDEKVLKSFLSGNLLALLKLITIYCDSFSPLENEIQGLMNDSLLANIVFNDYIEIKRTLKPEEIYSYSEYWSDNGKDFLYSELMPKINRHIDEIDLVKLKIDRLINNYLNQIYLQFVKNPDWQLLSNTFVDSLIQEKISKTEKEFYSIAEKAERAEQ